MNYAVRDLEVLGSNYGWVELGVCSTTVKALLEPKQQAYILRKYGILYC